MSDGFAIFNPDDADLPDNGSARRYAWLVQFVRDEARPFLVRQRQEALDGLARWLAFREEQHRQRENWHERSWNYLAHQPKEIRNRKKPPGPGWTRGHYKFFSGPHRVGHQLVYRPGHGWGWLPPELSGDLPPLDEPLPPPRDRDLSPDECWAALLAVHDAARDSRERIGPVDNGSYRVLCYKVQQLTDDRLPDLRVMLRTVTDAVASVADPPPQRPDTAGAVRTKPQGARGPKGARKKAEDDDIVAALSKHHQYDNGHCQNPTPIGVRQMEEVYGIKRDRTSRFFKKHFGARQSGQLGGHAKYKATCTRDPSRISAWIKNLNQDYSPHPIVGGTPREAAQPEVGDDD